MVERSITAKKNYIQKNLTLEIDLSGSLELAILMQY